MPEIRTAPNPDLEVGPGNKARWCSADYRRHGWHRLHHISRYGLSFRAARVMTLEKAMDPRLAEVPSVQHLTSLPWFSAMVVVRDQQVLFERYAPDFGADRPHSIQSITKTMIHLIVGRLVEEDVLDLSTHVEKHIPEIGSGYATVTLQRVLNMDVVNDYSEDFTDSAATYYRHEEAMGWRLPVERFREQTERTFLPTITSEDTVNRTGRVQYKDANTAVLAWVIERATNRPLRHFLAGITDAAGLEGALHITADRDGAPTMEGGACLTARDLSRYFSLFIRDGQGVDGNRVGSQAFIGQTLRSGIPMETPYEGYRYSNHLMVSGDCIGHGGWGGQFVLANLATRTVGVFLSVLENEHATNRDYISPVIRMLEAVTGCPRP